MILARILLFGLPILMATTSGVSFAAEDPIQRSSQIVSQHKAVFNKPPKYVPSFHAVDGPITGNGDVGLTVSGLPQSQTYWISKNDFWKSGPDFKKAGPSLIGGIDIGIVELSHAAYHIEQHLYEPVLASRFSTQETAVAIEARVLATQNVVVFEIATDKKPVHVQLRLWAKEGFGSQTASGQLEQVAWVTRKYNSSELLFASEAVIAMRCLAPGRESFCVLPNKPLTIVASVVTNHDDPKYESAAISSIRKLDSSDVARLKTDHAAWWQKFWAESYVELEDKLLEKYYYASHYIMACCSRNKKFPPGLYGNWITSDRLAWAGDYHLNYNHEAPFWALYSSNHIELTDCYDAPLLEHLALFQEDAKKLLKIDGAYASVGLGPKGLNLRFFDRPGMDATYKALCGDDSYAELTGQPMFLGQKSNAIFASMNMLLRYRYTLDRRYAEKVYPFLVSVADFWANYLKLENGRYVIYDDAVQEVGPWQGKNWKAGYGDINSLPTLGFLRKFLNDMLVISNDLHRDAEKRPKWKDMLDRLSDLPVVASEGRKRFRACGGGHGSSANQIGVDFVMLHGLVFPATNFGLGSDSEAVAMIRDDMAQWSNKDWLRHGNAIQTALICGARIGLNPDFLLARAHEKIAIDSYPNLWIYAGGGGIETCSAIPGMINEMMLQCQDGVVRLFPVFPAGQRASFYRLRTFGALLLSSTIDKGTIGTVTIESEKGSVCKLLNPWPGKKVRVFRNGKAAEIVSQEILHLRTEAGEKLALACEP